MKSLRIWTLTVALVICSCGIAVVDGGKDESVKRRPPKQEYRHENERDNYFHRHGYDRLDIPKGHYPAPGECRVWFPDRPPGHQPPPGNCGRLRMAVPPGAWLIEHPERDPDHVHVVVFDEHHPGTIKVVGEFNIGSGVFVRIVFGR